MQTSQLGLLESNAAPPRLDLTPREMAALAEELGHDHAAVAERDARKAQAPWGSTDWHGLRRPMARPASEPLALALDGGEVHARPQVMGPGQGPEAALRPPHGRGVEETWGDADGVIIGDRAEWPTPGEPSVGVARPWGGRSGPVDHGQSGVCTADASRHGSTRVDRRRDLPDEWFDAAPRERWHAGGRPEETRVTTTPAVALERRPAIVAAGALGWRWVTGEEACGRAPAVLDGGTAVPRWSVADVSHDTRVWPTRPATAGPPGSGRGRRPRQARVGPEAPAPPRVDQLAAAVPPDGWHRCRRKDGRPGPLVAAVACPRGVAGRTGLPGPDGWRIVRRAVGDTPDLQVSLSHAPVQTRSAALVRVAGRRWPMEPAFDASQGGLGLDHSEVRSGLGGHHHRTLWLFAHHGLGRARPRVTQGRRRAPVGTCCGGGPRACPRSHARLKRQWRACQRCRGRTTPPLGPIATASWSAWMVCEKVSL